MVISSDIVIAINTSPIQKERPKEKSSWLFLKDNANCSYFLLYHKFIWVLLKDELYKNNMWYIKYKVFFIKSIKV